MRRPPTRHAVVLRVSSIFLLASSFWLLGAYVDDDPSIRPALTVLLIVVVMAWAYRGGEARPR